MPFGLGFGETILILAIVLIFFGPRRMPEMGAALGKGIRDFKRALNGISAEISEGANPGTASTYQPFPAPAQPAQPAVVASALSAGAAATAVAPEAPAAAVVDSVSAPVGQIAADHPTLQRTPVPDTIVEAHASAADVTVEVSAHVPEAVAHDAAAHEPAAHA
jgi:sec-independent protein translocase protein TatA